VWAEGRIVGRIARAPLTLRKSSPGGKLPWLCVGGRFSQKTRGLWRTGRSRLARFKTTGTGKTLHPKRVADIRIGLDRRERGSVPKL